MNRFLFLVPVMVIVLSYGSHAGQAPKAAGTAYKNHIGGAAGFVTGYGVSYRRLFDEKNVLQITGFPFYYESNYDAAEVDSYHWTPDSGFSGVGNLSLGLTWLRYFVREYDLSVLTYVGANLNTRYSKDDFRERTVELNSFNNGYDTLARYVRKKDIINRITLGGGLGGEFQVWRLTGSLMVGIQTYYEYETESMGIIPSIEFGAYFGY